VKKKAVVLLSGGLDSAVTLYYAKSRGYEPHALVFDYGQRHRREMRSAVSLADKAEVPYSIINIPFSWNGSSLVDKRSAIPLGRTKKEIGESGIPSTYVPARNTVFLSIALSFAEAKGASKIFIGAHREDSSGYPDCRKEYIDSFRKVVKLGTKSGGEGHLDIESPLITMSKAEIIKCGLKLKVPFELTWSCYSGLGAPCGRCDSCTLRAKGFEDAGLDDPALDIRDGSDTDESKAPVTEIFSSIQGEGLFVGARQIFVRFKGCDLSCDYCDEASRSKSVEYTASALMEKVRHLNNFPGACHSVSITGGEPLIHADFLKRFLSLVKDEGLKVYLETNGIKAGELKKIIDLVDIISMDIKLPSSTGDKKLWDKHAEFLHAARGKDLLVKVIVTPKTTIKDLQKASALVSNIDSTIPFIIQPATPMKKRDGRIGDERLIEFMDAALKAPLKDVRIIPQVHKMLDMK